ncbi:class I SAM-dependent methyltransferase [Altererythrobacter sp. KTW20L]|uniref:class I SAM-dependent methyltransferase n=1 Tax=Altererythrobacter sp. KTW20L TaxID=2942210 RepID=UPI0020BFC867|nr:class I SAM-dependent methyltransferase [Altererythrobacter sp. KTW20L]
MTTSYDFDHMPEHVRRYDEFPPLFVPGYEASHAMAAAVLSERIGTQASLLVIGAGGGIEIARFARQFQGWRFTGVDPSQAMLDLASARLDAEAGEAQWSLVQGTAADAPEGPFDAATAFLCLSFVPDDGSRLEQLRAIRQRLKTGAPFLMIHAASEPARIERDFARFAEHARLRGAEPEVIDTAVSVNRTGIHILTPEREAELLVQAGFRLDGLFYRGLWIHGWEATTCAV